MSSPIKLIVGLGNPGPEYIETRHNVGNWFVQALAEEQHENFQLQTKFKGFTSKISLGGEQAHLMLPSTYMNESGLPVRLLSQFFKLKPEEICIIHDELDLPVGDIKVKHGGGHGGHNGLRDIIKHLGTNNFTRIRIGIDHPGDKNQVSNYVLTRPSSADENKILDAINVTLPFVKDLMQGKLQDVMKRLHTK